MLLIDGKAALNNLSPEPEHQTSDTLNLVPGTLTSRTACRGVFSPYSDSDVNGSDPYGSWRFMGLSNSNFFLSVI